MSGLTAEQIEQFETEGFLSSKIFSILNRILRPSSRNTRVCSISLRTISTAGSDRLDLCRVAVFRSPDPHL